MSSEPPPDRKKTLRKNRKRSGSLHDDDSGRITLTFRAPSLQVPDLDGGDELRRRRIRVPNLDPGSDSVAPRPERQPSPPSAEPEPAAQDLDGPTLPRALIPAPPVAPPARVVDDGPPGEPALSLDLDGESFATVQLPDLADVSDGWANVRPTPPLGARRPASNPPKRVSQPDLALDPPSSRRKGADALSLVERGVDPSVVEDPTQPPNLVTEMEQRFAVGDFTGSLATAELILGTDPGHELARRYVESCTETLEQLYSARIGDLGSVPCVTVPSVELRWLGLDHRAGFLLSLIDGQTSFEEILDLSGMTRLEATRILAGLVEAGVVRMAER